MQVSPSHSQRQLVSGQVGWGWRQATYPISANFGFAGILLLTVAIFQLVRIEQQIFLFVAAFLCLIGLLLGIYAARAVVQVCRQNSDFVFSQWALISIATYWISLVAVISASSETFVRIFVPIWWTLVGGIFTGISISLTLRSLTSKKSVNAKAISKEVSSDILNIVTYSDQTVLVSPSSLGQQPRQFNSLVLIVLGFFFWTMLDLSSSIRSIAAIAFTSTGITGFFTWQAQLRPNEKILHLRFSGLWGISSEYLIDIRPFSLLSIIKLQEASGELSWMQLTGSNGEITIPLTMTLFTGQTTDDQISPQNDQLAQILRQEFHLAKQETERDSIGLSHILLPQGAGILAGIALIAIGGLLLLLLPLPSKLSAENIVSLLGVCIVAPEISRFIFKLVAPNRLQSDRLNQLNHLESWEIGIALLIISVFISTQTTEKTVVVSTFSQVFPTLTLILGWLAIITGVCVLTFVRRTPLWTIN